VQRGAGWCAICLLANRWVSASIRCSSLMVCMCVAAGCWRWHDEWAMHGGSGHHYTYLPADYMLSGGSRLLSTSRQRSRTYRMTSNYSKQLNFRGTSGQKMLVCWI
jgi:hypothetical protein